MVHQKRFLQSSESRAAGLAGRVNGVKMAEMDSLVQLRRPKDPGTCTAPAPVAGAPLAYVETYGCQMNVADSETILGVLGGLGYGRTSDPAAADLILINTCAVREKAEERVFGRAGTLAGLKARNPRLLLGITGCMAEHLKGQILERAPQVDLVVGPDGYRRLGEQLERARAGSTAIDTALDRAETYEGLDPVREGEAEGDGPRVIGRVTIQRGCDKFCTFCVVPYTRGRERGVAPREILRQARALAAAGYREVQLLGQTVNSYRYEEVTFAQLLRAVAAVDGIERIRFTSPYPLDFTPDVISVLADSPKVCKHVHLPLQSGSDAVLSRMRRGYTYDEFKQLAASLRARVPGISITTDLLIGFCDESEAEFQATLQAQRELRFDGAFTFAYSERSGTYAARKMPDSVPEEVKSRRLAEVIALQRQITGEINAAAVGRRERVLIESESRRSPDEYLGRTDAFRSVIVPRGEGVFPGALVDVVIEQANPATLFGRAAG
jgi:tRNA-2-methylthio-N6-dimethylallyladenosine synthase